MKAASSNTDDASLPLTLRRGPIGSRRGQPAGQGASETSISSSARTSASRGNDQVRGGSAGR